MELIKITEEMKSKVKAGLLEIDPAFTPDELDVMVRLCYILVELDRIEMSRYNSRKPTFIFQHMLIGLARKHNGIYGI